MRIVDWMSTVCPSAPLADARMNDARFFYAELHLTALGRLHGFRNVRSHRAQLRVRHQALGTQHLSEPADQAHHVGSRNAAVELDLAALHDLEDRKSTRLNSSH